MSTSNSVVAPAGHAIIVREGFTGAEIRIDEPAFTEEALIAAYAEGRKDEREELGRMLAEEAAVVRRTGDGCTDGRYEWMAAGIDAVADTLRGIDSATGKTAAPELIGELVRALRADATGPYTPVVKEYLTVEEVSGATELPLSQQYLRDRVAKEMEPFYSAFRRSDEPQASADDWRIPVQLPDGRICKMRKCDLIGTDMVAFIDGDTLPPWVPPARPRGAA